MYYYSIYNCSDSTDTDDTQLLLLSTDENYSKIMFARLIDTGYLKNIKYIKLVKTETADDDIVLNRFTIKAGWVRNLNILLS